MCRLARCRARGICWCSRACVASRTRGASHCHDRRKPTMQRRDINAPDAPAPVGAYTHTIEVKGAERTVYISGQVGVDRQGNVPPDIAGQAKNVWSNLEAQLRGVGMTLDNIGK